MTIFFDDNFATHGDLLPGRWSIGNFTRSLQGGIYSAVSAETVFNGVTPLSFIPSDYTTTEFTCKIVGGANGLSNDPYQGIFFHLTNTAENYYTVGYLNSGNLTYNDGSTQTNMGIGFVGSYSISDLQVPGVTVTFTWTKITNDSSHFVCSFYTNESLNTLIATGEYDVSAGILVDDFQIIIDNPSINPTGTFIQRVSLYTPETPCFAEHSLIDTTTGTVKINELQPGMKVLDFEGKSSTVIKVWKSSIPREDHCFTFGSVTVTGKHSILQGEKWVRVLEVCSDGKLVGGYFYQIQTDSFGITIGDYIFSTWTAEYIESTTIIDMV